MSVTQLFLRGATLFPSNPCLEDAHTRRTFSEVQARVARIAGALNRDVPQGARCAVYAINCVGSIECVLGIQWAGCVYVPLNPRHHVDEAAELVGSYDVRVVFYHSSLAKEVEALRLSRGDSTTFVCLDEDALGENSILRWIEGAAAVEQPYPFQPGDVVSIMATGGTTGKPKGVMLTSLSWDTASANFHAAIPKVESAVVLAAPPVTHAAGHLSLVMMAVGALTILHDGFNAEAILDTIESRRVTHLYLPPTAIYMLLEQPNLQQRDFRSLRNFIYTSSPMSAAKLQKAIEVFGPVMTQFWGQSEAPGYCTCLTPEDHVVALAGREELLKSCGRPMLLTPVGVMSPAGALLPPSETGELVVRGPIVMAGYYKNAEATAEVSGHGWHHTGDVGYVDKDGYVFIVDRLKDMIITGGFNVYAREVENTLLSHEAVLECAVIGVPDPKWGEAVTAVVELRPNAVATAQELIAHCKSGLGSTKAPKTVEFRTPLPRTSVGKVDKKAIRQDFWAGAGRNV